MKKILFASSALVAAGMATSAFAAEPLTATVGGYMQMGLALTDGRDGVGVLRDGEIHLGFKGSSDNGLVFDGRVELEATSTGDQIDENWARVSGSWGSVKIGGDDTAKNAYSAGVIYSPGARIGYYDGFGDINTPRVQPGVSGASDAIGVHYDSPNFNGFQVGATYQPNCNSDGSGVAPISDAGVAVFNTNLGCDNQYSVGAVYSGDFDGFGFGIGAGYLTNDGNNSDTWHVGGNVSFSGFTVAAQYEENPGAVDSHDIAVGARYSTGPWTVAGGWAMTDFDGAARDPQVFAGWVTYALAPGVTANAGLEYGDNDTNLANSEGLGGLIWMTFGF